MWKKIKWELLDFIGYVFCEYSFQWFDVFDFPANGDDNYKWYHGPSNFIGGVFYKTGCFFYGIQDDKYPGTFLECIFESDKNDEVN